MAQEKDRIVEDIHALILRLRERHDIREVYVFGSFAKGFAGKSSDVDIAVVLGIVRDGSPFDERFEIFHEIQEHNSLYEALCFRQDEFEKGDDPLIRRIREEGIRIV